MRVQVVDAPAYTPPYDRSLCAALARAGAEVELVTSPFAHAELPPADGYRIREAFHRRWGGGPRALKAAEHVLDMLRFRGAGSRADVVHYQWLALPGLDARLLPPARPRVLTPHGWLRREAERAPGRRGFRRLLERMDAVVALSRYGAERLREAGVAAERIRVIPHGALDYLTRLPSEAPLPPELADAEGPVVLLFGLVRPYKGADVLLAAARELDPGTEVWVVGRPLGMSLEPLREAASAVPATVRFVERFVAEREVPAIFRRADAVALPYRDAEQSGVLYTALAFGKAIVASDVGGFAEVAAHGAARLVPPGDPQALAAALREVLADRTERERLEAGARAAAAGPYSWDAVAASTLALYRELLEGRPG